MDGFSLFLFFYSEHSWCVESASFIYGSYYTILKSEVMFYEEIFYCCCSLFGKFVNF